MILAIRETEAYAERQGPSLTPRTPRYVNAQHSVCATADEAKKFGSVTELWDFARKHCATWDNDRFEVVELKHQPAYSFVRVL